MRNYFFFITSLVAWLLLIIAKDCHVSSTDRLPFSMTLFWVATGIGISIPFFNFFSDLQLPLSTILSRKGFFEALLMAFMGLVAYMLYFFYEAPSLFPDQCCFFLWAPILYSILVVIFYRGKKNLIPIRLIVLAIPIGIKVLITERFDMSLFASIALVGAALMSLRKKAAPLQIVFLAAIMGGIISGIFSLFHWQKEFAPISFLMILFPLIQGGGIGFSMLLFFSSFQELRIDQSIIAILACLLTIIKIPQHEFFGFFPYLLLLFLIHFAMKSFRYRPGLQKKPVF